MQGFLRATLPTEAVTMSMYVTLVASSWTMLVTCIIVTVGSANVSGCLILGGVSMGAREGESLSRKAATPLKPRGRMTFGMGSGDSGDDVESNFSCMGCLHSSTV